MRKYLEDRPWGNFERFCLNETCTVKILHVNPNERLSLQYHNHREEFWRVIFGKATIVIGGQQHLAKEGNEFFIPKKTPHRVITAATAVKILEISFGRFVEKDIVRLEDEYGRNTES